MADLTLEGVSKTFSGGVRAVENVNLRVADKEFVVLVGPSGCGKSTTLRMIAGLEEVTSGTIRIGGRVVNGVPPKDRDIAMVFQNYALYPHLSVYRNLSFGLELRRSTARWKRWLLRLVRPARAAELARWRDEIDRRVREAARLLDIERLLDRMPAQLSGGERQRVAVGRAIVRQPVAFLFDEPLSNLDARLRVEMRRELKQLHRRLETTMVYVTHDQIEALTLGDRIVVMNQGEIQQEGPPIEVYDHPANQFVAGFLGSPPMNFITGRLTGDEGNLRFQAEGWAVPVDRRVPETVKPYIGQLVVLGIRPEDVTLHTAEAANAIGASVAVVEPLGDATIVELEFGAGHGGNVLLGKVDPRLPVESGATTNVTLNMDRAHLFDPATGKNLSRSDGEAA